MDWDMMELSVEFLRDWETKTIDLNLEEEWGRFLGTRGEAVSLHLLQERIQVIDERSFPSL